MFLKGISSWVPPSTKWDLAPSSNDGLDWDYAETDVYSIFYDRANLFSLCNKDLMIKWWEKGPGPTKLPDGRIVNLGMEYMPWRYVENLWIKRFYDWVTPKLEIQLAKKQWVDVRWPDYVEVSCELPPPPCVRDLGALEEIWRDHRRRAGDHRRRARAQEPFFVMETPESESESGERSLSLREEKEKEEEEEEPESSSGGDHYYSSDSPYSGHDSDWDGELKTQHDRENAGDEGRGGDDDVDDERRQQRKKRRKRRSPIQDEMEDEDKESLSHLIT
jgi:hypothetical protein